MSSELRQRRAIGQNEEEDYSKSKRKRITLETFDLYAKVAAEESVKTSAGGGLSLASIVVIIILTFSELYRYFVPKRMEHMVVDRVMEGRMRINFDVTFPALTCLEANIDAMDVAGEQQNGIDHDIQKIRLDSSGKQVASAYSVRIEAKNEKDGEDGAVKAAPTPLPADYCGSCYGAESAVSERGPDKKRCCNTCEEVRNAYQSKGWDNKEVLRNAEQCLREHANDPLIEAKEGEGCRVTGFMLVNKVAGNFHIAMGETHARGAGHIHQFNPGAISRFNVTHTIHTLSFGEPFPGQQNPLDKTIQTPKEGAGVYMYYIKVVPTVFIPRRGNNVTTNQYSVTTQYRPAIIDGMRQNVLPGLFFVYDFSPFMVTVNDMKTTSFWQLLTSLCAILGGVITAARLIDAIVFKLSTLRSTDQGGTGAQSIMADALIGAVRVVQRTSGSATASGLGQAQAVVSGALHSPIGLSAGSSGNTFASNPNPLSPMGLSSPLHSLQQQQQQQLRSPGSSSKNA